MKWKPKLAVVICVVLLALTSCLLINKLSVYGAPLFSDDFESGSFSAWTANNTANGLTTVETANPHHNTYDFNSTVTAAGDNYARCYKTLSSAYNVLYGRTYVKIQDMLTSNSYTMCVFNIRSSTTIIAVAEVYRDSGTVKWGMRYRSNAAFVRVLAETPLPAANIWYCVELMVDCSTADGTADGAYQMWVDGSSLLSATSIDTDYTTVDRFYLGRAGDGSVNTNIGVAYFDCAVVNSAYIGTEGDTTVPTYSSAATNTTLAGGVCNFTVTLADETALANYTFGSNNTGTWVNESWTTITGLSYKANSTYTLNSTVGNVVQWEYWFSDSSNNTANTGVQTLTITAASSGWSKTFDGVVSTQINTIDGVPLSKISSVDGVP